MKRLTEAAEARIWDVMNQTLDATTTAHERVCNEIEAAEFDAKGRIRVPYLVLDGHKFYVTVTKKDFR